MRTTLRETMRVARERRVHHLLLAAAALAASALLASGYLIASRTSDTGDLVQTVRFQALNTCIRANINSAIITLNARRPTQSPAEKEANTRIAQNLYPIIDCKRTQNGTMTVRLTVAETDKYVKIVAQGRAPVVKDGRVIGSRPSVLAGVKTIQGVGRLPRVP